MGWIKEYNYVGRCTGSHMINLYSVNFNDEHKKLKELDELHKCGELTPCDLEEDKDTLAPSSFKLND